MNKNWEARIDTEKINHSCLFMFISGSKKYNQKKIELKQK